MNPWKTLPDIGNFIAPCDCEVLNDTRYKKSTLRFDAMPQPYIGNLQNAKTVLLNLNPGFRQSDIDIDLKNETFMRESKKNLLHQSRIPFFYLMPELAETGGYKWWHKYLNPLIKEGESFDNLSKKLMCIEYMPYHSVRYQHNRLILPSQQYSFELLRKAMEAKKIILIMRGKKYWLNAVPELSDYPFLELDNPRNVWVSRKNMDKKNSRGSFDSLVATLRR